MHEQPIHSSLDPLKLESLEILEIDFHLPKNLASWVCSWLVASCVNALAGSCIMYWLGLFMGCVCVAQLSVNGLSLL